MSDCDYKYLMQWKWCYLKLRNDGGYAVRHGPSPNRDLIYMHTAVAGRMGLAGQPDHRDRDKLNYQRRNLRPGTNSQNGANRGRSRNNTSGYTGVSEHKPSGKWVAFIKFKRKNTSLGYYPKNRKIEAAYAYDVAAIKLFVRYANPNRVGHLLNIETKRRIKHDVLKRVEHLL